MELTRGKVLDDLHEHQHLMVLRNQNLWIREKCLENCWRALFDQILHLTLVIRYLHQLLFVALLVDD